MLPEAETFVKADFCPISPKICESLESSRLLSGVKVEVDRRSWLIGRFFGLIYLSLP
jgi:hypothetical protein